MHQHELGRHLDLLALPAPLRGLGVDLQRAIELVRTEPRRGAVEHFYRAAARAWFNDTEWALLPKTTRQGIAGQTLQRIGEDVVEAANTEGFDNPQTHVSYTLLDLDAEGMTAMSELLTSTLERALAIHAESAQRRGEGE